MLIIKLVNTNTGTNENAHYRFSVLINDNEIAHGSFDGHNRNDGWLVLVEQMIKDYKVHLNPPGHLIDL
jgi:hypothetical protein